MQTKAKLHLKIPLNLLFWGSDNWSGEKVDVSKSEVLRRKSFHRVLVISMMREKDERLKSEDATKSFNIEKFETVCRKQQLLLIGRTVRLDKKETILIISAMMGKCSRGRNFCAMRDSFVESTQVLLPSCDPKGDVKH